MCQNNMNKSIHYSSLSILIIMGMVQLFGIDVYLGKSGTIKSTPISIVMFFSIALLYYLYLRFIFKEEKFSICLKCEETFNYYELKDGMCPYCDIKTKDLEGYYDNKNDVSS